MESGFRKWIPICQANCCRRTRCAEKTSEADKHLFNSGLWLRCEQLADNTSRVSGEVQPF